MKNMLSVVILSALCSFSVNATQCEGYVDKLYKLSNGKVKVSLAQFSNTYDIKDESDLILITNAILPKVIFNTKGKDELFRSISKTFTRIW